VRARSSSPSMRARSASRSIMGPGDPGVADRTMHPPKPRGVEATPAPLYRPRNPSLPGAALDPDRAVTRFRKRSAKVFPRPYAEL
jgi:hypothetical protein